MEDTKGHTKLDRIKTPQEHKSSNLHEELHVADYAGSRRCDLLWGGAYKLAFQWQTISLENIYGRNIQQSYIIE